jgi:hypothetical protein
VVKVSVVKKFTRGVAHYLCTTSNILRGSAENVLGTGLAIGYGLDGIHGRLTVIATLEKVYKVFLFRHFSHRKRYAPPEF